MAKGPQRLNETEGGPIQSQDSPKVRLTLDLSQRLNTEVEKIAQEQGTTKADVLRFAIEFLSAATEARNQGMSVGAWKDDPNGNRRELQFIGI